MFQLSHEELESLRFQTGTSNDQRGGRRYLPYVFTQEGVAMLSGVLHSDRAVLVNIAIMRTFVKFRQTFASDTELVKYLKQIERKLLKHDHELKSVFEAIRQLTNTSSTTQKKIKALNE